MIEFANVLQNPYLTGVLTLFLVLYGGLARPQLPKVVEDLFDNAIFRMVFMFLIAFLAVKNATIAIMVAVAFVLTMSILNEQKINEGFLAGLQEDFENGTFVDNNSVTNHQVVQDQQMPDNQVTNHMVQQGMEAGNNTTSYM